MPLTSPIFIRHINGAIQRLAESRNRTAQFMSQLLTSGKLRIRDFRQICKKHSEMFGLDATKSARASRKEKRSLVDSLDGAFCDKRYIYIKAGLSERKLTKILVHECVHYLCQDNDTLTDAEEELAARLIADKALGVYFCLDRVKKNIQDMKDTEQYGDISELDHITYKQAQAILSKVKCL